jgi:hypothetical protein
MIDLLAGVSSVLTTLGGGGSPLGAVGDEPSPISSEAKAETTTTQTTGSFQVGGSDRSSLLLIAVVGLAIVLLLRR